MQPVKCFLQASGTYQYRPEVLANKYSTLIAELTRILWFWSLKNYHFVFAI